MFEKQLRKINVLSKYNKSTGYIFTKSITLPQVFFTYFVNSNKLPGFCVSGSWAKIRLVVTYYLSKFYLYEEKSKLEM